MQRRELFAYALPAVPLALVSIPLFIYLPPFYSQAMGLSLRTVGTVLLAARLWDVVTDPLVGLLSDRTRGRFGRRRPWLVAATPPTLLAIYMLFVPAPGVDWLYLLFWTMVLYLGWTMLTLPYQSWGAELSDSYHERTRISAFGQGGVILGTMLATGLPMLFAHRAAEQASGAILATLAWITVAALPPFVLIAVWLVPDKAARATPPGPAHRGEAGGPGGDRIGWQAGWRTLAGNKPFRRLLIAYLINGTANGFPATLFILFVQHVLASPQSTGLLLFLYFLSGVLAVPLWLRLSYRFGKHRTWAGAMLWVSAVFAFVPLLGPGDLTAFLVICVLSGAGLGADLVLPTAMQADVVDLDRAATGSRRTGLYFALWGMATKLALALAVGIAFPALDLLGFKAGTQNDAHALLALSMLYGLVPLGFKLVATALIWRFPLDAGTQEALRQSLGDEAGAARPIPFPLVKGDTSCAASSP